MPELPEVETIVRGLRESVAGARISRMRVHLQKMVQGPPAVDVRAAVRGRRIESIERRGKYAVLRLDSGRALVISLRMTGRLVVGRRGDAPYPYAHVTFDFEDGRRLDFADVRQFGRVRLVEPGERWDQALGPEPLNRAFTPEAFTAMLHRRTTPVKVLLLDQRRIAGIGNIYACEALWEAGIRPGKPAKALTRPAAHRLHAALVNVLGRAIDLRGSSVDDYVDAGGVRGGFQNVLSVYGKAGTSCPRCGGPIVRTVLAQRGTWWCRTCQK